MDFEMELQGQPHKQRTVVPRTESRLGPQDRLAVVNIFSAPDYAAVVRLQEEILEELETKVLQLDPTKVSGETRLAALNEARAARIAFERLQFRMKAFADEMAGEFEYLKKKDEALKTTPEEFVQRQHEQ